MSTARREAGEKGGQASMGSESVSAAKLSTYLKGIDFPCDKDEIVDKAEQNDAPEEVLEILRNLPEMQYSKITDVEKEFNQAKEKFTSTSPGY